MTSELCKHLTILCVIPLGCVERVSVSIKIKPAQTSLNIKERQRRMSGMSHDITEMPGMSNNVREEHYITVMTGKCVNKTQACSNKTC